MEEILTVPVISEEEQTDLAFDEIVRTYQGQIYRVLWCELRDEEAAATLTQECFLKAYRGRKKFRGEAKISTWLVRIAVNLARDYQRSRRQSFWRRLLWHNTQEVELAKEELADKGPDAERAMLAREELQRTMEAVKTLSPQQRTVFHLRFVEEMQLEEIAHAMGVECGTVKAHLSRAVNTLRQRKEQ